ncbi:MAG TPA: T9SS type A sorting domain-containing protein [Chitinophagales bacterium]|nr:T9SS type A sorting domain-containing protein [Chitinophagales bacterium]
MNNRKLIPAIAALFILLFTAVHAQSTWMDVYNILHTNCATSSCHGTGSSNQSFNVEDTPQNLYDDLINGNPANPWARDTAGNKLIVPGSPQTSFVMRKLSHCTSGPLALTQPFEGAQMPDNAPALSSQNLELILAWILAGAPETETFTDTVAGSVCDSLWIGINSWADDFSVSLFPNPAEKKFSMSYSIGHPSEIAVRLYDVSGKQLKTLFQRWQNTGKHTHLFDAALKPGVYLLSITSGKRQSVRKLLIQ